ncbi:mCG146323, partial [Mus musculus]
RQNKRTSYKQINKQPNKTKPRSLHLFFAFSDFVMRPFGVQDIRQDKQRGRPSVLSLIKKTMFLSKLVCIISYAMSLERGHSHRGWYSMDGWYATETREPNCEWLTGMVGSGKNWPVKKCS